MGDLKLALLLAYKSVVKGNRWALVLIILVMSLSFANLVLTPSILSGVTQTLDKQQVETLFGNIIIDPPANDYFLEKASTIQAQIEQVPGVIGVSPHLANAGFIEYDWLAKASPDDKGKSGTWPIIGIDPLKEAEVTSISQSMVQGSYLSPDDRDAIILGIEIAGGENAQSARFQTLQGVGIGDKVRVTYASGVQREYRVKGIFRAYEGQADRQAFVTMKDMVNIYGRGAFNDRASQLLVKIDKAGSEETFIRRFQDLGIPGQVMSWREYGGSVVGIVSSFNIIASLIGGIGLVVAAIVMFIVIYINVVSKKKQIGILRAIGIKTDVIIVSYLLQALFYAVLGIVFGGLIFGYAIQPYFAQHPISLPIGNVILAIEPVTIQNATLGLLAAAALAGFLPVLQVTRQRIIQIIWGS